MTVFKFCDKVMFGKKRA